MKRIASFAGIMAAILILLAAMYFIPAPSIVGHIVVVLGSILGIISFAVWIMS